MLLNNIMKGQVMNNQDLYFKNEETKYIFYLVALEGKIQLDFLNIDRGHYENRQRARNWYEEIKKKLNILSIQSWKKQLKIWISCIGEWEED